MSETFTLAACAEMLWRDRPMECAWRRLTEMGFHVACGTGPNMISPCSKNPARPSRS